MILVVAMVAVARKRMLNVLVLGLSVQLCGLDFRPAYAQATAPPKRILALVDSGSTVTAQIIVNSTAFGAGQPGLITPGLAVQSPRKANYLLSLRAEGQFLHHLQLNPELLGPCWSGI